MRTGEFENWGERSCQGRKKSSQQKALSNLRVEVPEIKKFQSVPITLKAKSCTADTLQTLQLLKSCLRDCLHTGDTVRVN